MADVRKEKRFRESGGKKRGGEPFPRKERRYPLGKVPSLKKKPEYEPFPRGRKKKKDAGCSQKKCKEKCHTSTTTKERKNGPESPNRKNAIILAKKGVLRLVRMWRRKNLRT